MDYIGLYIQTYIMSGTTVPLGWMLGDKARLAVGIPVHPEGVGWS